MTTITTIITPTEWSAASLFVQNTLCFNTRRDYAAEVRLFAQWIGKNAAQITLADLLAYREHLESRGLKASTVAKKTTVLRRLFSFLHEQGLLPRNPAAGLKLPRVRDESSKDILTLEECRRLLSVIDTSTLRGKRDIAILALLLLGGLRTCEVCRANVGDLRQVEEYMVLKVHGKGGKEADTRIRDDMYDAILAYLDARGVVETDAPLFLGTTHRSGLRMTTRTVQHMVKRYLWKAGIERPNLTVHSLRHTAITLIIMSGASILPAQEFARHSDPKTTTRYFHNMDRLKNHGVLLHPLNINR